MAGNEARATIVRNIAMGADQPQMWLWTKDIFDYNFFFFQTAQVAPIYL